MTVYDIRILSYTPESNTYRVEYLVQTPEDFVMRRSVTEVVDGKLSRNNESPELTSAILQVVTKNEDSS